MKEENYIIETNNLIFSYKKEDKFIDDLNICVPKSAIYGFLGANGAGKTTTIKLLTGLLKSDSQIKILGKDLNSNKKEIFSKVGVLIEDASLYEHLTARDNLQIVCNYHQISNKRINEVLSIVKLSDSNKKAKHFSMGMKQRLGIAIALIPEPELLILDEPVNGLDPNGIKEVRELIINLNKNFGTTVFLSSHLLSEIEKICTHIGIISNGMLKFQGEISELEQHKNATVLETSDTLQTLNIIQKSGLLGAIVDNSFVEVDIKDKKQIPTLIKHLVNEKIDVFGIESKQDTLEDLFLEITNI